MHAAHDQLVLGRGTGDQIVVGEQTPRGMALGKLEGRDHLALFGALAHQSRLTARAKRERKRIEQDRLPGAGLAGQRGKAGAEIDVQAIDQDDIADG